MTNAQVLNMPMELDLELIAVVGAYLADAELEFVDDSIDEFDRVRLVVTVVNF